MSTFHITLVSGNEKTGPIPVTTSSADTCPTSCPLKKNGCYAEHGPLAWHWGAVTAGKRGGTLESVCAEITRLPKHQLWRWAQAGDLPGDGTLIDREGLDMIVKANRGKRGFAFTHYDPGIRHNAEAIRAANLGGFTVNLSANNTAHADKLAALGIAPVVVVLPADTTEAFRTEAGTHISVCPATVRDDVTCAHCGICAVNRDTPRKSVIGFPSHGTGQRKAEAVAREHRIVFTRTVPR